MTVAQLIARLQGCKNQESEVRINECSQRGVGGVDEDHNISWLTEDYDPS